MEFPKKYDYIIAGTGAAGLMLASAMAKDSFFDDKSILLIDQHKKTDHDRTWCFWEEDGGNWDEMVFHQWDKIVVRDNRKTIDTEIHPFKYKMIISKDFYATSWTLVNSAKNIEVIIAKIITINQGEKVASIICDTGYTYEGTHIFNSIYAEDSLIKNHGFPFIRQHFIGWFIKTNKPVFTPNTATFMDFSVSQRGNTRFMYVLPWNSTEALIEYTLFSEKLLAEEEYIKAIEDYIQTLGITDYEITNTERGVIPMTTYPFEVQNTSNITHIGTAGGWSKACTGYTFNNSHRYTRELILAIKGGNKHIPLKNRFRWYDHVMLSVLQKNNHVGSQLFTNMFAKNKPYLVLKFLDEKTSIFQEIPILLKTKPFLLFTIEAIRTAPHYIFKKLRKK